MNNKIGWMVNDRLSCIPGTKTLFNFLLENISGLIDKTNGFTPFELLTTQIESELKFIERHRVKGVYPDYIIRNASYFRKFNSRFKFKTISLLQDVHLDDSTQHEVLNNSTVVVVNSEHTKNLYRNIIKVRTELIPLGVDTDLFKPGLDCSAEMGIYPNSILFVGAATSIKGFDLLMQIVNSTSYHFVFVMKDDYKTDHPRIKVFNQVNEETIVKIYNSCKMVLCTSEQETQHLGGAQALACNLPVVARRVGIYNEIADSVGWGLIANDLSDFIKAIRMTFEYLDCFKPRDFFVSHGLDMKTCMNRWKALVEEVCL